MKILTDMKNHINSILNPHNGNRVEAYRRRDDNMQEKSHIQECEGGRDENEE